MKEVQDWGTDEPKELPGLQLLKKRGILKRAKKAPAFLSTGAAIQIKKIILSGPCFPSSFRLPGISCRLPSSARLCRLFF